MQVVETLLLWSRRAEATLAEFSVSVPFVALLTALAFEMRDVRGM